MLAPSRFVPVFGRSFCGQFVRYEVGQRQEHVERRPKPFAAPKQAARIAAHSAAEGREQVLRHPKRFQGDHRDLLRAFHSCDRK